MDEPRIKDFEDLPPEIQARILRQKNIIPSRLYRNLTIQDRIDDAGTKPFLESEIDWVLEKKDDILIFASHDKIPSAVIFRYSKITNIVPLMLLVQKVLVTRSERGSFQIENIPGLSLTNLWGKIIKDLTYRIDSDIVFESDIQLPRGYATLRYTVNVLGLKATIILTDIQTLFLILRRRFEIIFDSDFTSNPRISLLAQKRTQEIFDKIIDDFQGNRIIPLYEYLLQETSLFKS